MGLILPFLQVAKILSGDEINYTYQEFDYKNTVKT